MSFGEMWMDNSIPCPECGKELALAGRTEGFSAADLIMLCETAIEVATLYIPGIPNWLLVTALIVMAALKFFLVVGFFMHLRYDSNIMRALFIGPLIIAIAIILALMALFSAFILLPRPFP